MRRSIVTPAPSWRAKSLKEVVAVLGQKAKMNFFTESLDRMVYAIEVETAEIAVSPHLELTDKVGVRVDRNAPRRLTELDKAEGTDEFGHRIAVERFDQTRSMTARLWSRAKREGVHTKHAERMSA